MKQWPSTIELVKLLHTSPNTAAWDLPAFLATYSLHDSGLMETVVDQWHGLLALIQWDMHWNRRVESQYQNLVIYIPTIYSVDWVQGSWKQSTLCGAESVRVSQEEREQMLANGSVDIRAYQHAKDEILPPFNDEGLTRTIFQSVNWSRLTVLHGNDIKLLCMDDECNTGHIPRD